MRQIVWSLTSDGRSLTLYEVDPLTRRLTSFLDLQRKEPMTEEEALKYMEANWPNHGAVRAAAETLGLGYRKGS